MSWLHSPSAVGSVAHSGFDHIPDLDRIVLVFLFEVDLKDTDRSQCRVFAFESEARDDGMLDRTDRHMVGALALFGFVSEPVAVPEYDLARVDMVRTTGPRSTDSGRIYCQKDNLGRRSHNPVWGLYAQADVAALEVVDLSGVTSGTALVICFGLVDCTDV